MIGVILAAGMAKRLRPLTDEKPKCLLEVAGGTLLSRTIDAMAAAGVDDLLMVTGYRAEMIREYVWQHYSPVMVPGSPFKNIRFLHNADYEHNNNIFSLWMAVQQIHGNDFLLMDSDILCDPAAVLRIASEKESALAVNRHEMGAEEMKVVVSHDGHITEINKTCRPETAMGESVGIEKIMADYGEALFLELNQMILQEKLIDIFYERAFERLIPKGYTFKVVDTTNYFSYEIDTPEDYQTAQRLLAAL
jgi:choline kinase